MKTLTVTEVKKVLNENGEVLGRGRFCEVRKTVVYQVAGASGRVRELTTEQLECRVKELTS